MSIFSSPKSACLKRRAGLVTGARGAVADDDEEEFDEIESLPPDLEHDEDDRDPDPERRLPADHAQGQARADGPSSRSRAREGKSRA